ncbi:uncharacterized protein V6R79_014473 [Siganus canaliculatus]
MPRPSVFFAFFYLLSKLQSNTCYTYQTKPLFLSFAELAALEGNSFETPSESASRSERHRVKTFVVKCHEDSIEVVMKAYLFDLIRPVEPKHLRLGPIQHHCTATESRKGEYVIRAPLTGCGTELRFTQDAVVFSNLLLFSPPPSPGDELQPEVAAIPVQCQYRRRYTVSSRAIKPTWSPQVSFRSPHLHLDFQLRLMTTDWSSDRKSPVYFREETVNIQASVHHPPLPLRVYVNSCVATLTPGVNSYPRHPFIDHQGCFADSQLHGSRSRFLPRVQDQILQIQLEPFLFSQDHRSAVSTPFHV